MSKLKQYEEEFDPERLADLNASAKGNYVWIMDTARWQWLRRHGPKDFRGRPFLSMDDATAYGRLFGHRIVIVERDCFEIGLF